MPRSTSTIGPPPSILEAPGAFEVAIEFGSLSKTYSMPGWRIGFAAGNTRLVGALTRIKSYLDYGAFTPGAGGGDRGAERPAGLRAGLSRALSGPARRAGRRAGQGRLAGPEARRDHVLLGAGAGAGSRRWARSASPSCCSRRPTLRSRPGSASASMARAMSAWHLVENRQRLRQAVRSIRTFLARHDNGPAEADPGGGVSQGMPDLLRIGIAGLGTVGAGTFRLLQDDHDLRCWPAAAAGRLDRDRRQRPRARDANATSTSAASAGMRTRRNRWREDPVGRSRLRADRWQRRRGAGAGPGTALRLRQASVVTANKAHACPSRRRASRAGRGSRRELNCASRPRSRVAFRSSSRLREGLAANRILRVYGILNGTCNFILTTMRETGREFADVLAEAQALGYAEADPAFDVDGIDAAHKLALLAALGLRRPAALRRHPHRGHPARHGHGHRIRGAARLPDQAAWVWRG